MQKTEEERDSGKMNEDKENDNSNKNMNMNDKCQNNTSSYSEPF